MKKSSSVLTSLVLSKPSPQLQKEDIQPADASARTHKAKRLWMWLLPLSVAVLIAGGLLLYFLLWRDPVAKITDPPYFVGTHNIEITEGDGIAYRQGVTAYDAGGREIPYQIDTSKVNNSTPGVYEAVYIATDADGNKTEERITVTVLKKPKVPIETLYALVDENIRRYGMANMDGEELAEFLYYHIKQTTTFVSDSDKSDWVAEAYRALTDGQGDCFTYYAVARAYFTRCGIDTITVQRSANARPGTHYWLLVNMGTTDTPLWYHWDACPHYMEYPFYSCLVTDDELLAYNRQVENYYAFDMDAYPRTPKK